MENVIDLYGVDPTRWPEIRCRVAILDEFVKLKRPPRDVRLAYARRMGLADSQFMNLARIWREKRSASALPGAGTAIGTRRNRRLARSCRRNGQRGDRRDGHSGWSQGTDRRCRPSVRGGGRPACVCVDDHQHAGRSPRRLRHRARIRA